MLIGGMIVQQKVVTIRCRQGNLEKYLEDYRKEGWRVVSTTKGPEITRIFFTYNWTIVLEKDDHRPAPKPVVKPTPADELLKAKKLLDDGAITEDEYDKLKQKILNY